MLEMSGVLVIAREDPGPCPACGGAMKVQKTFSHGGRTMKHGSFEVRETIHVCASRCRYPQGCLVTRRAQSVTEHLLPGSEAGYDTLVHVGLERFLHHRQRDEIRHDVLRRTGFSLSAGEVTHLSRRFLQYLEALHESRAGEIRRALEADGRYPLHVDATGEAGRGTILVAMAGWRRWVLDAFKIPTERAEVILPALRSTVKRFGSPCAVVRDLGKAMVPAVKDLVKELGLGIPVLSCHAHFLADVGGDMLEKVYGELRGLFRNSKIRPNLSVLARDLGRKLGEEIGLARQDVRNWQEQAGDRHVLPAGRAGLATVRAMTQWALDYRADGEDLDFPFDRPYLDLYNRCVTVLRAVDAFYRNPPKDKGVRRSLDRLHRALEPVSGDSFRPVVERLRRRADLFDELRDALRITPKAERRNATSPRDSLATPEAIAELNDIQAALEKLIASLQRRRRERGPAEDLRQAINIILSHVETYGESLWGHVVTLTTPDGVVVRIVYRTNNVLEFYFGFIKQGERRRSGRKNLARDLEFLPAAAALVGNLARPDYVELVCGSLDNLGAAFAELDAERKRRTLAGERLPPLGRSDDPIPEIASAALTAADRPLLRSDGMRERLEAAARSRAPRHRRRGRQAAEATVD
jgi:hypothetical protein